MAKREAEAGVNIIGTGFSGLVGSRVVELLSNEHSFEDLSLETGVDITDYQAVNTRLKNSSASWVFHFAAYTDVQGAEDERSLGELSKPWKVNVAATEHIAEIIKKTGKKMIYVDTDYAFDGKKKEYSEQDSPHPKGWYAVTKYEGAKRVLALGQQAIVIRIANPYRANQKSVPAQQWKKDFVHKMIDRFREKQTLAAATDQIFVPTFIDDIAQAIRVLIRRNSFGLYHVVGSSALSPFEAAIAIAKEWNFDKSLIKKTTFKDFFAGRAPIPQYANLKNDKIRSLGVTMRTFDEGLREVKKIEYNTV